MGTLRRSILVLVGILAFGGTGHAIGNIVVAAGDFRTSQANVLFWSHGGDASLVASISYCSDAEGFVWLFPVPDAIHVEPASQELFHELRALARPCVVHRKANVKRPEDRRRYLDEETGVCLSPASVVMFSPTEAAALKKWLSDHDCSAVEASDALRRMKNDGWHCVAAWYSLSDSEGSVCDALREISGGDPRRLGAAEEFAISVLKAADGGGPNRRYWVNRLRQILNGIETTAVNNDLGGYAPGDELTKAFDLVSSCQWRLFDEEESSPLAEVVTLRGEERLLAALQRGGFSEAVDLNKAAMELQSVLESDIATGVAYEQSHWCIWHAVLDELGLPVIEAQTSTCSRSEVYGLLLNLAASARRIPLASSPFIQCCNDNPRLAVAARGVPPRVLYGHRKGPQIAGVRLIDDSVEDPITKSALRWLQRSVLVRQRLYHAACDAFQHALKCADHAQGITAPLRIDFQSSGFACPALLSPNDDSSSKVRLYILAGRRVAAPGFIPVFAGSVEDRIPECPAISDPAQAGLTYLTALNLKMPKACLTGYVPIESRILSVPVQQYMTADGLMIGGVARAGFYVFTGALPPRWFNTKAIGMALLLIGMLSMGVFVWRRKWMESRARC